MIGECIHCGAVGPTMYGACKACLEPAADAPGLTESARRDASEKKRRERLRATKRTPPVVLDASAPVPRGLEARRVVDWRTGRVAGVVAYRRDESASVVEDAHLAACKAAGVWTPAIARAS